MAHYLQESVGWYETFHAPAHVDDEFMLCEEYHGPGWYWWTCQPGCLPDGPACGPFASEAEAKACAEDMELITVWRRYEEEEEEEHEIP